MTDFPLTRRHLFLGLGATALTPSLVSCSANDTTQELADQLAEALSKKDIAEIDFSAGSAVSPADDYKKIVAYMGKSTPTVTVAGIDSADKGKTVRLAWSWAIPGADQKWEYETQVALTETDKKWLPTWDPALVHPQLKESLGLYAKTEEAKRGDILGASDKPLVTLRPVVIVGLDKSVLTTAQEQEASARALAKLLEIDADTYVQAVKNGGEQQFVVAITLRQEAFEALDGAQLEAIAGSHTVSTTKELAPSAQFAPDILGAVGEVTAEDIEKSNGALSAGDVIGKGGLQEKFNSVLAGSNGYSVSLINLDKQGVLVDSGTPEELIRVEPITGAHLSTTLDADLQQKAVDLLKDQTSPSALVALRVSTGELLVAANGQASEGYSTALLAQYAPGSTFKIVTSLALLRKGMTAQSTVNCSETAQVDGRVFKNATGYDPAALGKQPLTVAMAHSCNTAFINERDQVSQADLQSAAQGLGLGMELDLGVATYMGAVPDTDDAVTHAASMIGQGEVTVSPLAMAVMTASAAKGEIVKPVLVKGQSLAEAKPTGSQAVTAAESKELSTLMRAVVTEGYLQDLKNLTPDDAMGKTGTAEFGNDNPPKTHSWVVAVHKDIAVAVVVEDGDLGAVTGQPIVHEFLKGI